MRAFFIDAVAAVKAIGKSLTQLAGKAIVSAPL
jgi:hypothetical protein